MTKILLCTLAIVAMIQSAVAQVADTALTPSVPYGNNPAAGHYLLLRGFKMYYESYGKGEPILIIHGNGGSINNFIYQIPYFSQHYHVVIADSRLQGKSVDTTNPGDSLSYEMMADDLNALLDTLHLDSCYVIGWSDGGINGLLMAIRHPDKVKKLAITGANLWPDSTAVAPIIYRWALSWNVSLQKKEATPEVRIQRKLAYLLTYAPHITLEALHTIQCPTLVIGGDHDVILPQHTLLIAQNIRQSDLWILPNSGHSTPIFYKDDFNRVVERFFQKPYRNIVGFMSLQ